MADIQIRWATQKDVDVFFGNRPRQSLRAIVIAIDGEPQAFGGIYHQGGFAVAFMDLKPGIRAHRKALVRAMKMAMELLVSTSRFPVVAIADENEPTAPGLLRHFGFEQVDERTYRWHG